MNSVRKLFAIKKVTKNSLPQAISKKQVSVLKRTKTQCILNNDANIRVLYGQAEIEL